MHILVPGIENKKKQYDVEIIYTRKNEIADERIEKLTKELSGRRVQIYVATSDLTEQRMYIWSRSTTKISKRIRN